ncbi:MAG TPA: hypothetical protein VGK78_05000 [Nocardioides sp.]|uniref:hypothetical protein n=1 Tax=Nocardioides sp. TaxID=35761 RepID=UPI002F412992
MRSPRELLRKGSEAALPTVRIGRRVRRLEEGVRENALLAVPLEEQVGRIEQSLVPLLEATQPSSAKPSSTKPSSTKPSSTPRRRRV